MHSKGWWKGNSVVFTNDICKCVQIGETHVNTEGTYNQFCKSRVHLCKWMSYQPPSTHWSCKLFLGTRNEVRNIILRRETGPVIMSFKISIYILGNNSRIDSVFWECISLDFLFHYYLMWIIMIRIGYCKLFNFQYKLPVHTMPTRQSCKEKFYLIGANTWCKKDCWKI